MNREYTEKLFDRLPSEQRKKILRTKMKGRISGFRRLDLAPSGILKSTLKSNEAFATQFLDAVMDMYGSSSEQHTDEEQFPKLTCENFLGLFARKCKDLDSSPGSCETLEEMVQEYETLTASDLSNISEDLVAASAGSEHLGQGDSEGSYKQTYKLSSIGSADMEEDYMSEFTQYIGYVQETNGYYNFWPVCVVYTAFEGRIADQIFQAAAGWNQCNQNELLQKIAAQLVDAAKTDILSGEELVEYLLTSVKRYRPDYSRNEILNIFISISQNFLTVFSGEPGTGKTSICNIVAHILGTSQVPSLVQNGEGVELRRYVPISIERGWTSKRDFIGYYNPLSQAFEQANKHLYDGLRLLDAEGEQSKYPYIVLLDEANLSPIEYYWADFMNICDSDSRFSKITLGNDIQLKIPPTLRFMATINNDDTTERLSPRLIDRAALIRLPDVPYTTVEDEDLSDTSFVNVVEWAALQAVFASVTSLDLDTMPNEIYKNICSLFRENMKLTVSPRVDRAIRRYWATAKNLFESEAGNDTTIIALDYAVAQKLLPKINGSGKSYLEFLVKFKELCEKNNLEKSGTLLANIIKRGEASMNYYQYF